MFLRILKKDLNKKRAMNLIVFLFITLAAMFVGAGLNNVISVFNGTGYYLDQGGVGDYVIITMGKNSLGSLDDVLEKEPAIESYRMDNVIYSSRDLLKKGNGEKIETRNVLLLQSLSDSTFHFFDKNNNEPAPLSPGHCYVTGNFMSANDLSVGDSFYVGQGDVSVKLIIDGKVKDALLGSPFMGNVRVLMHNDDFSKFTSDPFILENYSGQVCCIDTQDVDALEQAFSSCRNMAFHNGRDTIQMCYVMDMIVAFIILIMSVCLIIVSFVVLKVSLSFTITKEFREIGVMKAIGIKNFKIRSLFLTKYLILAIAGSLFGFLASIPLSKILMQSITENMVLGNRLGYLINAIGAVLVVVIILILAYASTSKVKKATPVDAIRTGQTGERYSKKSKLHLSRSHMGSARFMAVNDVLSSPRRYISIIIAFCLCMLFVLLLVNTTNTMRSDSLLPCFASDADLYMTDVTRSMELMGGTEENAEKILTDIEKDLASLGMPAYVFQDLQFSYPVTINGKSTTVTCEQGRRSDHDNIDVISGSRPQNANEIAITKILAKKLDVSIGDTITIDYGTEKKNCIITGYYQSFNQLGELIWLTKDAPTDLNDCSSAMGFGIRFTDAPSSKTINERKETLRTFYHNDEIFNQSEYVADCINVVDVMESVQYLLLGLTCLVVILVTILMELSFINDEKSQIALLKAMGFKNRKICLWQVLRFTLVGIIAVILAAILSIPMTHLCITPIFGMMGVSKLTYAIKPLELFLIYPAIVLAVTILISYLTSLSARTIKSVDTANIE